jgi:hypothetical protein
MNVKFIAQLAGAAGVGASWAWAITADRAEQRARRMAEDYISLAESVQEVVAENVHLTRELENANDRVDELEHRLMPEEEAPDISDPNVSLRDVAEATPEADAEPTEEQLEIQRTELQNLIAPYVGDPQVQQQFVEQARVVVETAKYDPPFVISQSDFAHDDEGEDYAKHTIHFYGKHQTLLDEEDEAIAQNEVENYVGWRNLRRFGDQSGQPDVVYVRNRRLDTDFEVVLLEDDDLPLHVQYNMSQPEFDTMSKAGKLLLPGGGDDDG